MSGCAVGVQLPSRGIDIFLQQIAIKMGDNRLPSVRIASTATMLLVALISLGIVVDQAVGHVALTFPPARKYDLDFLDNSRTKGPCGMPKGKSKNHLSNFNLFFKFFN